MLKTNPIIEFILLLGITVSANCQTALTVHQTATRSTCSNIVALSGAKLNCSNLTAAQKKALEEIPMILKMALANQDYLDAIMAKLEEISKGASRQTINAPNGIGSIGGTLINPQVNNFGYLQKTLSQGWMTYISGLMKSLPDSSGRGNLISCQMGDANSCDLAVQLVKVFRDAGWSLPGSGYDQVVQMNPPTCVLILFNTTSFTNGERIASGVGLPPGAFELAKSLKDAGICVGFGKDGNLPISQFRILIGTQP